MWRALSMGDEWGDVVGDIGARLVGIMSGPTSLPRGYTLGAQWGGGGLGRGFLFSRLKKKKLEQKENRLVGLWYGEGVLGALV